MNRPRMLVALSLTLAGALTSAWASAPAECRFAAFKQMLSRVGSCAHRFPVGDAKRANCWSATQTELTTTLKGCKRSVVALVGRTLDVGVPVDGKPVPVDIEFDNPLGERNFYLSLTNGIEHEEARLTQLTLKINGKNVYLNEEFASASGGEQLVGLKAGKNTLTISSMTKQPGLISVWITSDAVVLPH